MPEVWRNVDLHPPMISERRICIRWCWFRKLIGITDYFLQVPKNSGIPLVLPQTSENFLPLSRVLYPSFRKCRTRGRDPADHTVSGTLHFSMRGFPFNYFSGVSVTDCERIGSALGSTSRTEVVSVMSSQTAHGSPHPLIVFSHSSGSEKFLPVHPPGVSYYCDSCAASSGPRTVRGFSGYHAALQQSRTAGHVRLAALSCAI